MTAGRPSDPHAGGTRRPAQRLARTTRRIGWLAAAMTAVLLGGLFSWTLGRAAAAPPTQAPLPAAEAKLLQRSTDLARRISSEQQQLTGLAQQVQQFTRGQGAGPAAGAAGATGAMPVPHAMTGAS